MYNDNDLLHAHGQETVMYLTLFLMNLFMDKRVSMISVLKWTRHCS